MRTCLFLMLALAAPAYGVYYDPPDWDSEDPTFTHQEWRFPTDQRWFVPPTVDQNPFSGDHYANILGEQYYDPIGDEWVWDEWTDGEMAFRIPNQKDLLKEKLVWLEIAVSVGNYDPEGPYDLLVDHINAGVGTGDPMSTITLLEEEVLFHAGFYLYRAMWRVDPQPEYEWVSFVPVPDEGRIFGIFEVDIDTICIPEPGTLTLLSLAGLVLLRRRR